MASAENQYKLPKPQNYMERDRFVSSVAGNPDVSLVDYLNSIGQPSDRASRDALAAQHGIQGSGTAEGNTALLNQLRGTGGVGGFATPSGARVGADGQLLSHGPASGATVQPERSPADIAFESYLKSLQPSDEETSARKYLNQLLTQSSLDQERALNMGETLGFATGEAGRVGRQNQIAIDAASRGLDALTGYSRQRQEAEKARLDYEQGKLKQETRPGFGLSPGQERWEYDPKTGQFVQVAKAPENMSDAEYKRWQVENLKSQITDRSTKSTDRGHYTIPPNARNQIMAYGVTPAQIEHLQEGIRKYGLNAVLDQEEEGFSNVLRKILDPAMGTYLGV